MANNGNGMGPINLNNLLSGLGGSGNSGNSNGSGGKPSIIGIIILIIIVVLYIRNNGLDTTYYDNSGDASILDSSIFNNQSASISSNASSMSWFNLLYGGSNTGANSNTDYTSYEDTSIKNTSKDKYTLMIYMCGSNLESDGGYASADLEEILK